MDVRPFSTGSSGLFTVEDYRTALKVNPLLNAIGGHSVVPYNGLEAASPDIRYITLLRDPVQRYVSQYRHWVEKKHLNISIQEFLEHEEIWNFQTRKLAGTNDLETAKRCLEGKFATVGIVENFDEFLVLFQGSFGNLVSDIRYTVQNTASDRSATEDLLLKWGDDIRKRNELDIALYDFVQQSLLPRQRDQYGSDFMPNLQAFKQTNCNGPMMTKRYIDYLYRKLYIEPATGLLRLSGGLPYKGSY
jgi:hypothetical protein